MHVVLSWSINKYNSFEWIAIKLLPEAMQLFEALSMKALYTHPRKERVETVDLLSLSHIGIILGDALQGQFLHQVDLVRLLQVFALNETKYFYVFKKKERPVIFSSSENLLVVQVLTMNFCTLMGKVAEYSRIWRSFGKKLIISSIRTTKSWESNLSAYMKGIFTEKVLLVVGCRPTSLNKTEYEFRNKEQDPPHPSPSFGPYPLWPHPSLSGLESCLVWQSLHALLWSKKTQRAHLKFSYKYIRPQKLARN